MDFTDEVTKTQKVKQLPSNCGKAAPCLTLLCSSPTLHGSPWPHSDTRTDQPGDLDSVGMVYLATCPGTYTASWGMESHLLDDLPVPSRFGEQ